MRKIVKWVGIALAGFIGLVFVAVLVLFISGRSRFNERYEVEVPSITLPTDEASIARGEHLVSAVAHCAYCHGDGLGGDVVVEGAMQGMIVAPNLTRGTGGLGAEYTAEDWVRAIRHGILPEGRSVFIMPSVLFNVMGKEDLAAIIAYLQTIPPVDNELQETAPGPMFLLLIGAGPLTGAQSATRIDHDAPFSAVPEAGETAEYGGYLATIAQCIACHGVELAGGRACGNCPIGPNLTPGGELGGWNKETFMEVIRTGTRPDGRELDPIMPWQYFGNMTDVELGALWAYLQSQPALENQIAQQ